MSQYPPAVPPGYPPQGFGGPGQPGFGPQGYSLPAMNRTSGAAICSLVCGLILCVPFITGLVAIITGVVGIVVTGRPGVRGRGMAIAGLILGILNIGGASGGTWALLHYSQPMRAFTHQYVSDLNAGKIDQCLLHSSDNLKRDQLDAAYKKVQAWGTLQDTTVLGMNFNTNNGNVSGFITGICTFSGGQHTFQMTLMKDSGQLKVNSFIWQN